MIEARISRATAEKITFRETARIKTLNPGRDDVPGEYPGMAAMSVLGMYAANGHI